MAGFLHCVSSKTKIAVRPTEGIGMKKKCAIALGVLLLPGTAQAYLGLGPVLPFIGSAVVLLFAILLAVVGVFLKPIMKRLRNDEISDESDGGSEGD